MMSAQRMTEAAGLRSAICERAQRARACAQATVAQAAALRAETGLLVAETAEVCQHALELQRMLKSRVGALTLLTRSVSPLLRTSGRVTRRAVRRRLSASSARRLPDDVPVSGERPPRADDWANATVFGARTIDAFAPADASGDDPVTWTVREIDARGIPGARGARCLMFENHRVVRRVWEYPADWASMPPAALLAIANTL